MSRKDIIWTTAGSTLCIAAILLVIFLYHPAKTYFWGETLSPSSKQPYDISVITGLLDGYFPGKELRVVHSGIDEALRDTTGGHKTYLFIGNSPFYSDSVCNHLLDFVRRGNDVFFAAHSLPDEITETVFRKKTTHFETDSTWYVNYEGDTIYKKTSSYHFNDSIYATLQTEHVRMNLTSPAFATDTGYDFACKLQDKVIDYAWQYFHPAFLRTASDYLQLGTIQKFSCNYIEVPFGNGRFYFHSDPVAFTNFFLISEDKLAYASKVFSYLRPGDIILDQYSISPKQTDYMNGDETEGPLAYILAQPGLRMSWYVLLAALLLFMLFRSKRMQQYIPVLDPNVNRSLEFVRTIGRMYFLRHNNRNLVLQKKKLFLQFIGERYNIPTQQIQDAFITRLHLKSGISQKAIAKIFRYFDILAEQDNVSDRDLIECHELLDHFYKNCS